MIGLDTTVLLTHEIEEARGHHDLRAQIREASQSGNLHLALAPQVLQEFVHAATDPKRFRIPLTMDQALTRSRFWWEAAEIVHCHPGSPTFPSLLNPEINIFQVRQNTAFAFMT